MKKINSKHKILILGASGFIGNALYKELYAYFNTFGTYNISNKEFESNQHYFQYNIEEDDIHDILEAVKPSVIISSLRGNFSAQILVHQHLLEYVKEHNCKLLFYPHQMFLMLTVNILVMKMIKHLAIASMAILK